MIELITERGYALHIHEKSTELYHDDKPNQVFKGPKHRERAVAFIDKEKAFEQSERIKQGAEGP